MSTKPILLLSSRLPGKTASQSDCDCGGSGGDCACADVSGYISGNAPSADTLISLPTLNYQKIGHDRFVVFNPENNVDISVINASTLHTLNSFKVSRTINKSDDFDLINKMIRSGFLETDETSIEKSEENTLQVLSAWLHLTDRCNLRCSYCYLPHVREDMSSETGMASIDAIFRSANLNNFKQIKLKYAGGESLLRYPLILELHSYAEKLAQEHGISLEEVVLSNGTLLTEEMAITLMALGIRLMISMDGMGHYHDSQRPYAGGRGSFKDVSDAVDLALSAGLTPNISVTVSGRTAEGLPDIMEWILERELPFSLNFYRENELSSSQQDLQLDEQKIIDGMKAAFKVIENNLPKRGFLGGIIDRANLSAPHTHTCGVGENYLVFDQNGQVAKCQMQIRKPVTNIHAADPLALIRADQIGIQNLPVMEKEGCKECEWKHWCTGGCPLATHRATGRYDVKSPNCNIYKALYPEALRLEGLRLIKYSSSLETF